MLKWWNKMAFARARGHFFHRVEATFWNPVIFEGPKSLDFTGFFAFCIFFNILKFPKLSLKILIFTGLCRSTIFLEPFLINYCVFSYWITRFLSFYTTACFQNVTIFSNTKKSAIYWDFWWFWFFHRRHFRSTVFWHRCHWRDESILAYDNFHLKRHIKKGKQKSYKSAWFFTRYHVMIRVSEEINVCCNTF